MIHQTQTIYYYVISLFSLWQRLLCGKVFSNQPRVLNIDNIKMWEDNEICKL